MGLFVKVRVCKILRIIVEDLICRLCKDIFFKKVYVLLYIGVYCICWFFEYEVGYKFLEFCVVKWWFVDWYCVL